MDEPHLWSWRMPAHEQARCWCQPFLLHHDVPPPLSPIVLHRPMPGYVFHEYGEHGPLGADCILEAEPVFECLDG